MTARYFSHSPRGFANEITIYAVEKGQADEWAAWFNRSCADAYHELVPITRQQAERLLRRDGVVLAIDNLNDDWLHLEGLADSLNPQSVASAQRCAIGLREDWEKERAFERDMLEMYPEFAEATR
jgi:hypothetical protein